MLEHDLIQCPGGENLGYLYPYLQQHIPKKPLLSCSKAQAVPRRPYQIRIRFFDSFHLYAQLAYC